MYSTEYSTPDLPMTRRWMPLPMTCGSFSSHCRNPARSDSFGLETDSRRLLHRCIGGDSGTPVMCLLASVWKLDGYQASYTKNYVSAKTNPSKQRSTRPFSDLTLTFHTLAFRESSSPEEKQQAYSIHLANTTRLAMLPAC